MAIIAHNGDEALWMEVTLRKDTKCAATRVPLRKGDRAYSPVGNQMYRAARIAAAWVEAGGF